jgi:hypothetical protein
MESETIQYITWSKIPDPTSGDSWKGCKFNAGVQLTISLKMILFAQLYHSSSAKQKSRN